MSGGNSAFEAGGNAISSPIGDAMGMSFPGLKLTSGNVSIFGTPIAQNSLLDKSVAEMATARLDNSGFKLVQGFGQTNLAENISAGVNQISKGINMNSRIGAGFGQALGG